MRAYYYDNLPTDQRLPHFPTPAQPVPLDRLTKIGVHYWRIPIDETADGKREEGAHTKRLDEVARERGYRNRDVIDVTREGLGESYEQKIKSFFEEHMHEDEEIRYILSGSGYFDVREMPADKWIRLAVFPGDLLVIPSGIYHRFTLDIHDCIRAVRLFKDEPKWVPHNRGEGTDENIYRQEYLKSIGVGA